GRAGAGSELREGREAVLGRDPEHRCPPVLGRGRRAAHAGDEALLPCPQLLLAQERWAGGGQPRGQLAPGSAGLAASGWAGSGGGASGTSAASGGRSRFAATWAALASSSASIAASSILSISRFTSGDGGSILPPVSSSSTGLSPVIQDVSLRGLTRRTRETADGSIWVTPRTSPSVVSRSWAPHDGQTALSTGTVAEHHGQVVVSPLGLLRSGLIDSLLPLDRCRWLRRDVVDHPVHPRHLVDDAAADLGQDLVRQLRPISGHAVVRGHRANCYHVRVRSTIPHDAHAADRREDGERLPDAAVQPGRLDLVDDDPVGLAQRLEPLRRDLADDPDREPGARERLAVDHRLGQAQLETNGADLVLEQVAQRLDELEPHVGGEPADVVVGLDLLGGLGLGRGALDHVRVERSLGQEVDLAQLLRLLLEDPDELVADDPPLLLGVDHAGEAGQEALPRVDH